MFESLDEHIKHDTEQESTRTERILRWVAAVAATVLIMSGLYFGVQLMD